MESIDRKDGNDRKVNDEIYSKVVRAGKRTYFFDVKSTRKGEYYLTVTESKKRYDNDGKHHYEKHKIFLYKEDFEKFADGLDDAVSYIRENQSFSDIIQDDQADFSNVEFEDLTPQ